MSGTIFLLQDGNKLVGMQESAYDSEDLLQKLLADHPDLLAGEQIDSEEPRKWVLVSREMPVPDEEDGAGRWSLDHLFLDQDAVPTLVEVKRSSDARLHRREVIGQILDYAANAVVYWPLENIRNQFEQTAKGRGDDPTDVLTTLLGSATAIDSFWQNVKTNLQAGRIRLVLVADEIPQEVRRIVEFLNGRMDPAEVLAIEVKQFKGGAGLTTLVPRVVGQTAIAEQKKPRGSAKYESIDEDHYWKLLQANVGQNECNAVKRIIQWAGDVGLRPNFNKGQTTASFIPYLEVGESRRYPMSVQTIGRVYLQMRWLRESFPFRDERKRNELCERLNAIPGVTMSQKNMTGFPVIALQALANSETLRAFLDTMTWVVEQLRSSMLEPNS